MPRIAMPGGSELNPKEDSKQGLSKEEILQKIDGIAAEFGDEPVSAAEQIALKREEMARKRAARETSDTSTEKL